MTTGTRYFDRSLAVPFRMLPMARTGPNENQKATRHLTNTSAGLHSSQDKASQESSQHIVHNGQPACGSFVAKQTASQSSNVGDTVASAADLVFCSFG